MTLEPSAKIVGKGVQINEYLRELVFSGDDQIIPDHELYPLVKRMFSDRKLLSPGGESALGCQARSVAALKEILQKNRGQKTAIGTHGAVMTLMLESFDSRYGYDFLKASSKPDVYKLVFHDSEFINVERLWTE